MSYNFLKKSFVMCVVTFPFIGLAQDAVVTSGGNASGSGGTASFSIGQTVYTTNSNSSGTVAQGVQHAYEVFEVGIKETTLNISLSVYPNPTTEYLTLSIGNYNNAAITYHVYDLQGKLILSGPIVSSKTTINMSELVVATYFVQVHQEGKVTQVFKVIKNK